MKNRIAAVVIIVVGVLLYFLLAPSSSAPKTAPSNEAAAEDRMMAKGEIVNLVRQQSRLYSAEQTAHKKIVLSTTEKDSITTLMGTLKWTRPWSKSHIEIPLTVTFKAYLDMEKIGDDDITVGLDSSVTIVLPDPVIEMTSCEIDHSSEIYDSQIFASAKSQEFINRHVTVAVGNVWGEIGRISRDKIVANARDNANKTIAAALLGAGFKKVNLRYRSGMDAGRLTVDADKALGNIKY